MGPILVTGGAGSLGKRVVRQLLKEGQAVRAFDLPDMDFTGIEGKAGIEVFRGDITDFTSVQRAVEGVSAVIHLAALLPPASEKSRELTFAVNVKGTTAVMEALKRANPGAPLVFSSSVSTYGNTTRAKPPISVDHPQQALDFYAESKIAAERSIRESYPDFVILRISGISVPTVQSPPKVWPFMAEQRIEFIHRDDVVKAVCAGATLEEAKGKVFNIAGGTTWRTTGRAYVRDYYDLLGVSMEEARFQTHPGWFDWYDTGESQRILRYQSISYQKYVGQLRREIKKMMSA